METPAVTPPLRRHHCAPSLHGPLILFASHSSPIPLTFLSLSHTEQPRIPRRSSTLSPRYRARRRPPSESAPPLCGPLFSSCPCAPSDALSSPFPAAERRPRRPPHLAGAEVIPSVPRRRYVQSPTTSTAPSSSPRRPGHRRRLPVAGATPEHLAGDLPEPSTTTATPLPASQGEAPPFPLHPIPVHRVDSVGLAPAGVSPGVSLTSPSGSAPAGPSQS